MLNHNLKRISSATVIAVLTALVMTLLAFLVGLAVVFLRGNTTHIPGLIDYVSDSSSITVQPAGSIAVTFLLLVGVSFPFVLRMQRGRAGQ